MQASFLMQRPLGGRFLVQPLPPSEPNKECMVCGTAQLQLALDTTSITLAHFVNKVHTETVPNCIAGRLSPEIACLKCLQCFALMTAWQLVPSTQV